MSARLGETKTGPRTIWLGPEAARLVAALPRSGNRKRVFPDDLTSDRLYTFWIGIREQAGLSGLRIHDCRHTWASQGVMNGVGLATIGRLLGHRQRETTAIYAHLDDGALRDAAAQAAAVIARAMGYRDAPPSPPDDAGDVSELDRSSSVDRHTMAPDPLEPTTTPNRSERLDEARSKSAAEERAGRREIDWLGNDPFEANSDSTATDGEAEPAHRGDIDWLGGAPVKGPSASAAADSSEPPARRDTHFY